MCEPDRSFVVSGKSFSRSVSCMCWKLAKVRALSNDIICDWMHVCLYSWLCALLGMYDACVPIWEWVLIFMIVCPVGDMCLCFDAKFVMCIHMICDKYMIGLLMCMSRGQHEVRTDATCLYWFVFIWFVMNIWLVYTELCSYDSWWIYDVSICTEIDSYDLW